MWKQVVEGVEHRKWMSGNQIARGGVKSGVKTWRRSVSEDVEAWKIRDEEPGARTEVRRRRVEAREAGGGRARGNARRRSGKHADLNKMLIITTITINCNNSVNKNNNMLIIIRNTNNDHKDDNNNHHYHHQYKSNNNNNMLIMIANANNDNKNDNNHNYHYQHKRNNNNNNSEARRGRGNRSQRGMRRFANYAKSKLK